MYAINLMRPGIESNVISLFTLYDIYIDVSYMIYQLRDDVVYDSKCIQSETLLASHWSITKSHHVCELTTQSSQFFRRPNNCSIFRIIAQLLWKTALRGANKRFVESIFPLLAKLCNFLCVWCPLSDSGQTFISWVVSEELCFVICKVGGHWQLGACGTGRCLPCESEIWAAQKSFGIGNCIASTW